MMMYRNELMNAKANNRITDHNSSIQAIDFFYKWIITWDFFFDWYRSRCLQVAYREEMNKFQLCST